VPLSVAACTGMLLTTREEPPRAIIVPNRRDIFIIGCVFLIIPNSKLS
jgi:hypothetical protein